jgi:hypothetical protein
MAKDDTLLDEHDQDGPRSDLFLFLMDDEGDESLDLHIRVSLQSQRILLEHEFVRSDVDVCLHLCVLYCV